MLYRIVLETLIG